MKQTKISKRVIIIAAAAGIMVFGVIRYVPILRQRFDLREAKAQQEQTLISLKMQADTLPVLRKEEAKLVEVGVLFEKKIPKSREIAQLWKQIAEIMSRHGLSEQSVEPENEISGETISSIPLKIQCTGTFSDIFEFFREMEQFDRLIHFENVSISNSEDYNGRVCMKAKAYVYFQNGA